MEFKAKEDISLPQAEVWAAVTDFETFERQALRRGAKVVRLDGPGPLQPGAKWEIAFAYRGRDRKLTATVDQFDQPNAIGVDGVVAGLSGVLSIELLALSPRQTRLSCALKLVPKSLTARVLVQSMKLTRSSLQARFEKRLTAFARDLEQRS